MLRAASGGARLCARAGMALAKQANTHASRSYAVCAAKKGTGFSRSVTVSAAGASAVAAAYALGWPLRAEEEPDTDDVAVGVEEEEEPRKAVEISEEATTTELTHEEAGSTETGEDSVSSPEEVKAATEQDEIAEKKKKRIAEFIEMEKYFEHRFKEEKRELEREYEEQLQSLRIGMERQVAMYRNSVEQDVTLQLQAIRKEEQGLAAQRIERERQEIVTKEKRKFEEARLRMEEEYNERLAKILASYEAETRRRAVLLADFNTKLRSMKERVATASQKEKLVSRTHQICAALFSLLDNLEKSRPFQSDLARLRLLSEGDETLQSALGSIPPEVANHGVRTPSELLQQFLDIRSTVRTQALVPEGGGVAWQLAASALAFVTQPVKGNVSGSDPDAILARAEHYLQRGDVQAAVSELDAFKGLAGRALQAWIASAKTRIEVEQAVGAVRSHVSSTVSA